MKSAAQTDCPACEEGYICRQGEGCLLVEVFGDEQPAARDQVQREVASVMKALAPMGGTKEQSDACIALGRLAAWAEAGLSRV